MGFNRNGLASFNAKTKKNFELNKIFEYAFKSETIFLRIKRSYSCKGCFFLFEKGCLKTDKSLSSCLAIMRSDNTPIIFERVKNLTGDSL